MGHLTLREMRDEVAENATHRITNNERIDRWINVALYDFTNTVKFQELRVCTTVVASPDFAIFEWNEKEHGIFSVINLTDKIRMLRESEEQFALRDRDARGAPEYWTRSGLYIKVWPRPSRETDIEIVYKRIHSPLVNDGDKTILHPTWDYALILHATINALLFLGDERTPIYQEQLQNYLRNRNNVKDDTAESAPLTFPQSWEEIQRIR